MITTKRMTLAILCLLCAGLYAGATAQVKQGATISSAQPIPIGIPLKLNAIEISDGAIGVDEKNQDVVFGYSFLGRVSGSMAGTFTLSMNCTPSNLKPGQAASMTGGVWAFPISVVNIKGEVYSGSIYGTVTGGSLNRSQLDPPGNISITMAIEGGTQMWLDSKGTATFRGFVVENEKGPATLTGTLTVNFE